MKLTRNNFVAVFFLFVRFPSVLMRETRHFIALEHTHSFAIDLLRINNEIFVQNKREFYADPNDKYVRCRYMYYTRRAPVERTSYSANIGSM